METVKLGSNGEAVKMLQKLLSGVNVDGIFGKKTQAAVMAYQAAAGLKADGICGAKTWSALMGAKAQESTQKYVQPVDYKQYDSRWAQKIYSRNNNKTQTMKSSGCGPTACADVIATLIDKTVTPWDLAQFSMQWGTRTANSGTSWSFFRKIFEHFGGLSKFVQTSSMATAKACVDAGGYVVCSMGPGYWTKGGHFICMWKYDNVYIYCNDPASAKRKKQKESEFIKQRKQFFCFYK